MQNLKPAKQTKITFSTATQEIMMRLAACVLGQIICQTNSEQDTDGISFLNVSKSKEVKSLLSALSKAIYLSNLSKYIYIYIYIYTHPIILMGIMAENTKRRRKFQK